MSMTYKEVKRTVRFKERDNDEARFSDYEIKEAVNEAIRYISNKLADSNADFNEKNKFYNRENCDEHFVHHGAALPPDFLALVAVKRNPHDKEAMTPCLASEIPRHYEYKVQGDKIWCGSRNFFITYKASIKEVEEDDDEIDIPYFAKDHFVTLVRRILTSAEGEIMREAQEMLVDALIPKRRYTHAKIRMPFKIGGN